MADVLILSRRDSLVVACVADSEAAEYREENTRVAKWEKTFDSIDELSKFLRAWARGQTALGESVRKIKMFLVTMPNLASVPDYDFTQTKIKEV